MALLAWHFLKANRRTGAGNLLVRKGSVLRVAGPPALCKHGLHGSVLALDALRYAPGPIVERVELRGETLTDTDKIVATERKCLWWADATPVLHEFACLCAEDALARAGNPDPRSVAGIAAKRAWVRGEIDDELLTAARDAARDAESVAARAAVWAAWTASAAERDAASDAAWAAASAAARAAVWAAWTASAAARDASAAARAGQNARLTNMLMKLAAPAAGGE